MSATTQTRLSRELELMPADTVVDGLPVVTVAVDPDELTRRAGLTWSHVDTELGPGRVAVVRLAELAPRFALTSYDDAPYAAVSVAADGSSSEQNVDALLAALRVRADEVLDRIDVRAPARRSTPRSARVPARSPRKARSRGTVGVKASGEDTAKPAKQAARAAKGAAQRKQSSSR